MKIKNIQHQLLLIVLLFSVIHAGTTGKVAGIVIDNKTGEPLIGCNVWIDRTDLGSATDMNGYFFILNIPPGIYDVRANMIGYTSTRITNIDVISDLTTSVDFSLLVEAIKGQEVIVVAEKPLITKDLTATTAIVNSSTIKALPVTEISDILELQAGFVDGHLRGGRSGEVAFWLDGVPMTDVYDGQSVVDVNKNSVEEMQIISGAFNAEYGQAMSGIVNIVTKDGSNDFRGSVSLYAGDFLSSHDDIFLNINKFNPITTKNIEADIQGSIFPGKLYFYANARWIYFQGQYEGKRLYRPQSVVGIFSDDNGDPYPYVIGTDPELDSFINTLILRQSGADMTDQAFVDSMYNVLRSNHADAEGDGKYVPMDWNQKLYGQLKLIWKISPFMKLRYTIINDDVVYQDYTADFNEARNYRYNPDGILTRNRTGLTQLLQFHHSLGVRTFYTLGVTRFDKNYHHRTFSEANEDKYVHELLALQDPYSFRTGGANLAVFERNTVTNIFKGDITSQITKRHMIKAGIDFRDHELDFLDADLQPPPEKTAIDILYDSPFLGSPVLMADSTIHTSRYNFKPYEIGAYIQDKIEFDEFIINAGFRFDYFDPKGKILADESDPSIFNPIKAENRYYDVNGNGIQDLGEESLTNADREEYWYKNTTAKWKISPRLGISFPITDKGVVHFSYGHFFQIPRFEYLYQNPDYDLEQGTGNIGVVGNADLRPEKTVSGELGIKQQLAYNLALDVTGYFRDIRDLAGTRADEISLFGGSATYSKLVNSDFAYVRGMVLSLVYRETSGWSGNLDYTFQIAKGSASDPRQTQEAIAEGALPEIHLVPLDWNQTHTVNGSVSYNAYNWGGSMIAQFGSGLPYSPQSVVDISSLVRNSANKPFSWNVDMRGYYMLPIGSHNMTIFIRAENLFDRLNQTNVYDDSGLANETNQIKIAKDQNVDEGINSVDEWFTNETFYSRPRRIEVGVTYDF
jgi:outer membrane receptor for ferrienterochelin and colicin